MCSKWNFFAPGSVRYGSAWEMQHSEGIKCCVHVFKVVHGS